jgi:hypothetical protein
MKVLLLLPLIACATPGHKDPATLALPDGGALGTDSESARVILRNNCGTCHLGTLPEHKPAAVEVFDLDEAGDWSRKLTAAQWKIAISRLSASDREEQLFEGFAGARAR